MSSEKLSNSEIRDEMDGFQTSMNGRKKFFGGLCIVRNLIKDIPMRNKMFLDNTFVKGFWYNHRDENDFLSLSNSHCGKINKIENEKASSKNNFRTCYSSAAVLDEPPLHTPLKECI
ncbi:hypothetical protein AVEN_40519-1 [Araneus ventricosus]|uniref:Uncharacterized protein n=1 Tax=Araneus ventricosus TaxID=182803 RepID=A0A4Y2X7W8_ARAVE|nr:hypothetical protein AVEN_40519-1 [Araneus ventricosus]